MKLVVVTTHPIQYQTPWFRALAAESGCALEVGFAYLPDARRQGTGFGVPFRWDVPLLEGYRWSELERSVRRPSLHGFFGLRLRGIDRWLRSEHPDAVVVTGWNSWALVQAATAARRLGLPLIARGDSPDTKRRSWARRLALRLFLRRYDAFLVVGQRNHDFYRGLGLGAERLFRCPHFVDNPRLASTAAEARRARAALRDRFAVPAGAICGAFVGKFIPQKNLGELFAALPEVVTQEPRFHLLMIGDGVERPALELAARDHALPISFAGFVNQSEIALAYATADLVVLPSRSETWGLVVNEAMACGLPAVVSDRVGCAPDLVVDGATGFTYPSGDARGLARAIVHLARDQDLRRRLGQSAQERVCRDFSVERAVEGTLEAARWVTRAAA